MKPTLNPAYAVRIHENLCGVYGHRSVANKFSHIEDGIDKGIELLLIALQRELGAFNDRLDAIAWALENASPERVPSVLEIRELCKRAPRKELAIEYKPEPADPVKVAEITAKVTKAISGEKDHMRWAKFPASCEAFAYVVAGSRKDSRLMDILKQHVIDGVCDADYKLQTIFRDGWVAV